MQITTLQLHFANLKVVD